MPSGEDFVLAEGMKRCHVEAKRLAKQRGATLDAFRDAGNVPEHAPTHIDQFVRLSFFSIFGRIFGFLTLTIMDRNGPGFLPLTIMRRHLELILSSV